MSANDFEERVITVPLRSVQQEAKQKRASKAMRVIRDHLAKHFKVDADDIRLDPEISEVIWARGRKKPPSKLRVRAARFDEDGERVVEAEPAE